MTTPKKSLDEMAKEFPFEFLSDELDVGLFHREEIETIFKRVYSQGYLAAVEELGSAEAFEYWRKCGNAEIVKGMIIVPNKNDWASWLRKRGREKGILE